MTLGRTKELKVNQEDSSSNRYVIQSIDKALDVLELLAEHESLSLNELTEQLSQPKSSLYRILLTLELRGFIKHSHDNGYSLGYKHLMLTKKLLEGNSLRDASLPEMKKLSDKYGDTVNLGVLSEGQVIYLEIIEGTYSLRMTDTIGTKCPIHATAIGKAIVAHIPEQDVSKILKQNDMIRFTSKTISEPEVLMEELKKIRLQGYALDNEEMVQGARCLSAPIFDMFGHVVGAISLSGAIHRFHQDQIDTIAADVMKTTQNISSKLGFVAEFLNNMEINI